LRRIRSAKPSTDKEKEQQSILSKRYDHEAREWFFV